MAILKGVTSRKLRQEFRHFSHLPNLWTRSFFVSTGSFFVSTVGNISSETIRRSVEELKKRGGTDAHNHTQAGTAQANTGQTGHVRTNDTDQHGVCQLAAFSSGSEQGNQQDLQGVFQREIPVRDPQPNHPGLKSQKKHQQARTFRKMWCSFNNQNFRVEKSGNLYSVSFPTLEKRIGVPVIARSYQQKWLERMMAGTARQGTAKLFRKKRKWFIALPLTFDVEASQGEKVMGIDLGLRYLAVASIGTRSLFFKGNQCAYIRRRYAARRRKLGKAKKLDAIRKSRDREAR
jgi:transposase